MLSNAAFLLPMAFVGGVAWSRWYYAIFRVSWLGARHADRLVLAALPIGLVVALAVELPLLRYEGIASLLCGLFVVGMGMLALPVVGMSAQDDVLERNNPAATCVVVGAFVGLSLCFLVPVAHWEEGLAAERGALAALALFGLWFVLELLLANHEAVSVGRDVVAGIQLGAFLAFTGGLFGLSALWAPAWGSPGFLGPLALALILVLLLVGLRRSARGARAVRP
jgi:hypothetical protein